MKVICLMGMPGTGKTTLMRAVMERIGGSWVLDESTKLVPYHKNEQGIIVLGKYEKGETFAGCDRMSMAVQPEAVKFLQTLDSESIVLFEGDRLANQSFLELCVDQGDTRIFYLQTTPEERQRRYDLRGSNQSEQFINGRQTKYNNLCANFVLMSNIVMCQHSTPEDTEILVQEIIDFIQELV